MLQESDLPTAEDFFFGTISRGADRRSKFRDNFSKRCKLNPLTVLI